jgi:hypothetical protein
MVSVKSPKASVPPIKTCLQSFVELAAPFQQNTSDARLRASWASWSKLRLSTAFTVCTRARYAGILVPSAVGAVDGALPCGGAHVLVVG